MAKPPSAVVQQDVAEWLRHRYRGGPTFVKSKEIAAQTGMSAKRVGQALSVLQQESADLEITRWGGNSNGTTWRIKEVVSESSP